MERFSFFKNINYNKLKKGGKNHEKSNELVDFGCSNYFFRA